MTLIWRGGDELLARLDHAVHEAVKAGGEQLLESSRRILPTESGELSASARVTADGDTAAVSYDTPYAQLQHESGYPRHQPPETKHYLSRPMLENGPEVLAAMDEALQRELGI